MTLMVEIGMAKAARRILYMRVKLAIKQNVDFLQLNLFIYIYSHNVFPQIMSASVITFANEVCVYLLVTNHKTKQDR